MTISKCPAAAALLGDEPGSMRGNRGMHDEVGEAAGVMLAAGRERLERPVAGQRHVLVVQQAKTLGGEKVVGFGARAFGGVPPLQDPADGPENLQASLEPPRLVEGYGERLTELEELANGERPAARPKDRTAR